MKTSTRSPKIGEAGGSYTGRRGHVPQTATSDTNHHVTETISDAYEGHDSSKRDFRPLNLEPFIGNKPVAAGGLSSDPREVSRNRPVVSDVVNKSNSRISITMSSSTRKSSFESNLLSPSISLREDTPQTQFSLSDIDCESDPADVAQALSNLQALRRMSMDVGNTSDPDLPSYQGTSMIPLVAPTSNDNDDDPSRLFWVPARVHPELAPMEFKTFLENRIHSINRHSGESSTDSSERSGLTASILERRKSMLSRQIDNGAIKGLSNTNRSTQPAEERSLTTDLKIVDLKELDTLVNGTSKAIRKLTLETKTNGLGDGYQAELEDIPILPQAPGIGLRRSTRTTYRRGSLRKGERVPLSKRAGNLRRDIDGEESVSPVDKSSPISPIESSTNENFNQPSRGVHHSQNLSQTVLSQSVSETNRNKISSRKESLESVTASPSRTLASRPETLLRSGSSAQTPRPDPPPRSASFPSEGISVPKIVETPPLEKQADQVSIGQPKQSLATSSAQIQQIHHQTKTTPDPPLRSSKRSVSPNPQSSQVMVAPQQGSNEVTPNTPMLIGNSARTDALTFIPTLELKKSDKKSRKEKDDTEISTSKKATWNWFKGGDEKDKKDKKKDDDREWKKSKRALTEKSHDTARLDVLQSTLDTGIFKAREGPSSDRDSLDPKSLDEKKKDNRKFSTEKKEKDSIFSSIFGGSKKKSDRDASGKKGNSLRTLSPDPPLRLLKPDVDYNWTRFSILEERAIYRMAHIKLANPRRALYSQVLLSNFMYSYLAKVQQMHPHMQIPQSALQKKQEMERRQKEQEQQALQQAQESDQYTYDYHQGIAKYAEGGQLNDKSDRVSYIDDSQIYDYDHQNTSVDEQGSSRPQSRASQHNSENGYEDKDQYRRLGNEFYSYGNQQNDRDEDEMW
ncbi:hypothetical protein K3495_g6761 [Podosphaera aphanis]|nr:hypothetical protein K3495_g6761 [Podosphaera aphanis]